MTSAMAVFAVAGVVALLGKQKLKAAVTPTPKDTIASGTADVDAVKTAAREGRAT